MYLSKSVAVIGAGPSGLVTLKELLAEGHSPVCFEKAAGIGGVFRFGETDGVVWESCTLTSSGRLTAFSDFPVRPDQTGHMSIAAYVGYLSDFCDRFQLHPHLRFSTAVESVEPDPEGGWIVTVQQAAGLRQHHFDAVAICSGLHQHPRLPRFPGQDTYSGEILHGAHYRRPAQVSGKRVLVVGAGESGADITAEVAAHASQTVLSLRRGVSVVPRNVFGVPRDLQTSRLQNCPADWIAQTRHPVDNPKRAAYRWTFLPFLFVDKALQTIRRIFWDLLPLLFAPGLAAVRTNLRTRSLIARLLQASGGGVEEQFGTKSDAFVRAIAEGRCRLAPAVDRFDGANVVFSDGSAFTPDLIICCTGFETRVPFLPRSFATSPRFFHTFHPGLGHSLAFIGFLRPAFGAIPPLTELQARWFALLLSGSRSLPDPECMQHAIDDQARTHARRFRALRGSLEHLVDFTSTCDALAEQIGCKPTKAALRQESRLFRHRFFAGPFVAAQYRLIGPHANPALAREIIESLPVGHPWPDYCNLRLRWALSRILRRLRGPAFAPKLDLAP